MVTLASHQSKVRGGPRAVLTPEDIIFPVRHDRSKADRLRLFLSWKDVRKNVRDKDGRPGEAMAEDMLEVARDETSADGSEGSLREAGHGRSKLKSVGFIWDSLAPYAAALGDTVIDDKSEDDPRQLAAWNSLKSRLRAADEATRTMTHEQYLVYTECRQASFTYKKLRKFGDWSGLAAHGRVSPETAETLGFLAHELVVQLTETALDVKAEWEISLRRFSKRRHPLDTDLSDAVDQGPFAPPLQSGRKPLRPDHIVEAYRRLRLGDDRTVDEFRNSVAVKHILF